eukprot:COSAG03_NODE_23970_length_275_cov_6.170455_1_plen_43_part_10
MFRMPEHRAFALHHRDAFEREREREREGERERERDKMRRAESG